MLLQHYFCDLYDICGAAVQLIWYSTDYLFVFHGFQGNICHRLQYLWRWSESSKNTNKESNQVGQYSNNLSLSRIARTCINAMYANFNRHHNVKLMRRVYQNNY